jgi:hypothetical protein
MPSQRSTIHRSRAAIAILGCCMALLHGAAAAQEPDSLLRARFIVPPPPPGLLDHGVVLLSAPGISIGSPVAFGPGWGDLFVGAVGVNRQRYFPEERGSRNRDGVVVAGFGLGDPVDLIGLEVLLASYSTVNSGLLSRAGMSLKAHRMLPGNFAVGAGVENVLRRGEVEAERSVFAVVSRVWLPGRWELPVFTTSLGVGNGRFRSEQAWLEDRNTVGVFGNVAFSVWDPVSFIADYNQDLNLGVSVVPLRRVPVSLTAGVLDVLGQAGDGRRFMFGIAAGYSFVR